MRGQLVIGVEAWESFSISAKIYILMRIIVLVSCFQFWTLSYTNSIVDIKIPNTRNCQVFSLACGDEIIVKLSELSFYWIYILTKFLFPSLSLTLLSYFSRLKIVKLEFVMINSDTQPRHIWYLTLEGNIPSCNIAVNVKLNLYQYGAKYFSLIFSNILRSLQRLVWWSSDGEVGVEIVLAN